MTHPPSRYTALAVLSLALGACASAATPPDARFGPTEPPLGRECRVAAIPAQLPHAGVLVDAPALQRDLLQLWRARGISAGYAVLSVAYDENGWNARRSLLDHDLPPAVADSVQALVFRHRREVAPGAPWGVRLRVDVAEEVSYAVGRQELCAARAMDLDFVEANPAARWSAVSRDPFGSTTGTVWVRVLVNERGGVAATRVERSSESLRSLTPLMNRLQMVSFQPALVDGAPVASWVRLALPVR